MLNRLGGYDHDHGPEAHAASARALPPLEPLTDERPVTTRANWRWMLATFLTGVAAIALMGGALYTTFDGRSSNVLVPQIAGAQQGGYSLASTGDTTRAAKGDRMSGGDVGFSIKQIFHESTITKVGSKEFIRVKPYARVAATLASLTSAAVDDLPPFNPLKLFAEEAEESAQAPKRAAFESSGEIAVTLASFSPNAGPFADDGELSTDEAELAVRELVELSGSADGLRGALGSGDAQDPGGDSVLVEAPEGDGAISPDPTYPDEGGNVSYVTEIEKSAERPRGSDIADKAIIVSRGDTLSTLLLANGATPQEAREIAAAMQPAFQASQLKEEQEVRIGFAAGGGTEGRLKPVRVSIFDGETHLVTVGAVSDNGAETFVRMAAEEALLADEDTLRVNRPSGRAQLYESLYETAMRAGLPVEIVARMVRIHAYDVDFKRNVQNGDSFEVFYVADDNEGHVSGEPDVLFSAITIRGETKKFYRFRTPDDGIVDYYDEDGKSAKKFLIRKPMNGGTLRSGFGMRRHPILGYRKMHTGVDWAARSGTPVVAAGNGVVEKAEWTSGYGRYTVIRHANGYKTAYAHQSAFAPGIEPGVKVRQGQVIGYVGSTGLSTGPHLHYEVIVNGRYVDPMRIRVPRGRTLQGQLLASFQREKTRIERLMSQPPAATRVATAREPRPARPAATSIAQK